MLCAFLTIVFQTSTYTESIVVDKLTFLNLTNIVLRMIVMNIFW